MKAVLGGIGALVVAAGIVVGGWQLGWWAREEVVDRTSRINERTFARQTALQQEVLDLYRDITKVDVQLEQTPSPVLRAQREALRTRLCDAFARMTTTVEIPSSARQFAEGECA